MALGVQLPEPGDVLSGKYTIVRILGEGGMGVVYEAMHNRISQRVAIKMLHPSMMKTGEFVQRFEREARAIGRLKSRHTARVLDVEETAEGIPYMVMEFLEGHDLETELERRGALPVVEAVDYLLQTCSAMAEAHDLGIVHRDLKPANLFICRQEGEAIIRVLDFGISKSMDGDSSVTTTATAMGTPLYMSPEQVRSARAVDPRADIWSLGIIAYEMLAGKTPFTGENPTATIASIVADDVPPLQDHRPELPEELASVVHTALQKRLADRYADIRAFARALAPFGPPGFKIPSPSSQSSIARTGLTIRPAGADAASANAATAAVVSPDAGGGDKATLLNPKPAVTMQTWSGERKVSHTKGKVVGAASSVAVVVGAILWFTLRVHDATPPSPGATGLAVTSSPQPPHAPSAEPATSSPDLAPTASPQAPATGAVAASPSGQAQPPAISGAAPTPGPHASVKVRPPVTAPPPTHSSAPAAAHPPTPPANDLPTRL